MKGNVIRIKRFSTHDGPGIRTAVFLKGCALRCAWCHTPEGLNETFEVWHNKNSCIECGKCVEACKVNALSLDREKHSILVNRRSCNLNGDCVAVCPTGSMQFTGKEMTTGEIIHEILKDRIFYETSGGGVTITGGDPFFQPDFTDEILSECKKKKIHTAVETSTPMIWRILKKYISNVDLFIFDLKIFDPVSHTEFTGVSNEQIFNNFRLLAVSGKNMIVRIPLVKNITDSPANIDAIANFVRSVNPEIEIEKIPYNPLTRNNYDRLGIPYTVPE